MASRAELLVEIEKEVGNNPAVLGAFRVVNRADFVPANFKGEIYTDKVIPVNGNSTMSEPVLMARMMDALWLTGKEKVLEIGTGLGYGTALLGCCSASVATKENDEDLALTARTNLQTLGYDHNIAVHIGDGALGVPEEAPFDAIIVTAGARYVPQALVDQLKEGGRMVVPVGEHWQHLDLTLVKKICGNIETQILGAVSFVPLISPAHGGWTMQSMEYANAHEDEIARAHRLRHGYPEPNPVLEILERMAEDSWGRWGNINPNFV